jgi:hypothetical protein
MSNVPLILSLSRKLEWDPLALDTLPPLFSNQARRETAGPSLKFIQLSLL